MLCNWPGLKEWRLKCLGLFKNAVVVAGFPWRGFVHAIVLEFVVLIKEYPPRVLAIGRATIQPNLDLTQRLAM